MVDRQSLTNSEDVDVKKLAATMALIILGLGAAACGGGIDRDGTIDLLMEQGGLDRETAECVTDGAIDSDIPEDVLTGEKESSEAQDAQMQEIIVDCIG